jgi:sporadic carbohydrate cluster protein (TIGR04323 family)
MNLKGYVSVRSPVPVSVQNMVVRDYCTRNGHRYSLSDVEFVTGFHMLQGFVWYKHAFDGVCAYSMHLFPEDEELRDLILEAYADIEIHFALENYVLPRDREKCEEIWRLKSLTK